ncbi:ATP-binding protein [Phascolarctobacterium faecium]|uniref:ATP-binding protein n=1 Tax=Phascolarctobacterium faecium TaxID=33025 RepID=UPI003AB23CBE
MSFFYSPFTDKNGDPIDIFHIQHRHLNQLLSKEIEEGYQVEYKTNFTDSVKKKIPKIITSFANSAGGWLFIGVDEKTLAIDKLEKPLRTDYSQIISQLLREHVSPLPRFNARFLKSKGSSSGVLAVYIFEGNNPPYVTDGTVYIRNGSSSEPAKSQRSEIDVLYQKRKDFDSRIKDFCKREIYYPMDDRDVTKVVLCNIYIMNTAKSFSQHSLMHFEELAKKILNISPNQFHNYIFSNGSVVFQNSKVIGQSQIGTTLEVFSDYSAKIHIPIQWLDDNERDIAIKELQHISGQHYVDDFLLLDGFSACQSFQYIVQQYFQFLKSENIDISTFLYQMSFENAENSILYFDSNPYKTYISKHDIPYCCKSTLQTTPYYFKQQTTCNRPSDFVILLMHFFFLFGLSPKEAGEMYIEAVKANPTRNLNIL